VESRRVRCVLSVDTPAGSPLFASMSAVGLIRSAALGTTRTSVA
jgi:hypothetical protein